ncbi:hypothetical protein V6N13_133169 [Hibiscus sabdariffa]|uniref:Uncharacterized protein n=1 Tax=Hibiscus sabdariffa TaxID=183260 RepID=A0ABR2AM60_9ROSI
MGSKPNMQACTLLTHVPVHTRVADNDAGQNSQSSLRALPSTESIPSAGDASQVEISSPIEGAGYGSHDVE